MASTFLVDDIVKLGREYGILGQIFQNVFDKGGIIYALLRELTGDIEEFWMI